MSSQSSSTEDDLVTLLFMLFGGLATGTFSVGVILIPVRDWMVQHYLLANGEQVVVPFIDGVGFGWPQIVVAAGLIVVAVLFVVWLRRRASDRV